MKLAVIGCGHWGKNLVRNFHELGVLSAICDSTEAGQATARTLVPNAAIGSSFENILDGEVDAVVIATPAETHYTLARRALEAGKDLFIEKPLALAYEEGRRLVRLAQAAGRILMVGHVLEYHPAIRQLLELVHSGALGKIQYIYSNRLSLGKIRREENILWSFAPHDIAILLRLVGEMPFQVIACGGSYLQPNIADVTFTHLLFDNGVRAAIHVSWLHPFKEQRLVIVGSQQMASFDDVNKKLLLYAQRVEWKEGLPIPVKGDGQEVEFARAEPLRLECEAFLHAIQTRTSPLTDGESGLRVLKILQAAQRSLVMNGEPVSLPIEPIYALSERDYP